MEMTFFWDATLCIGVDRYHSFKGNCCLQFHDIIKHIRLHGVIFEKTVISISYPQSSSTLWNYSKCGVYTVESEAGC
jgi:hypothetical protein